MNILISTFSTYFSAVFISKSIKKEKTYGLKNKDDVFLVIIRYICM